MAVGGSHLEKGKGRGLGGRMTALPLTPTDKLCTQRSSAEHDDSTRLSIYYRGEGALNGGRRGSWVNSRRSSNYVAIQGNINLSIMAADLSQYVVLADGWFLFALLCIVFNPLFWNTVARWEYRTRSLTRTFGSPYVACYCLGAVLLFLAAFRSHCFTEAMKMQPHLSALETPIVYYVGLLLLGAGTLLAISSFFALGFAGTYLGDYFGILMDEKVTGFPFNIMENPMYWGSTANYLGLALVHSSPAGLILTAAVAVTYKIAILFEGPFTEEIYRRKEESRKRK
ncbi:phosphatidylethanolamine N-methyltransferase [Pelodytes ibericus]